ncbi:hypothetical protein B0T21DRAFT_284742 [Apiosordaria backusii]|uniref:FAD-binding FR-type domain-containing protein n=1 Tax=Apiosordaria backusii TaxID=314023 RepID=A0AA40EHU9_9PEZI|nr:hypothetical protein B0T21DRAFT_284742 [Apiosordaria backusii]
MSGRLLSAGLRLPRQVAADGRLDLMKMKCVSLSSHHAQRRTLQRIYEQKIQHRHFHASVSQAAQSRFSPPKSKKDDQHYSQEELKTARGQDEPRPSRKEKKREREKQKREEDETSRSQKREEPENESEEPENESMGPGTMAAGIVIVAVFGYLFWQVLEGLPEPLNGQTFSPFEIIDRQQVSPTAFIITVKPVLSRWHMFWWPATVAELNRLEVGLEREGTWAVEIKQPELQVARDYTPLPNHKGFSAVHEDTSAWTIARRIVLGSLTPQLIPAVKLLIRKTDGGEVSSWLSRRKVGDIIELRGPHQSFDVVERAGRKEGDKRVVFLAGGTGIAPALQAAESILQCHSHVMKQMPQVDIIWANRSREDCRPDNPIIEELERFKRESRGKINYVCTVDEEGSFITADDIITKTQIAAPPPTQPSPTPTTSPQKSWFWSSTSSRQAAPAPEAQRSHLSSAARQEDPDCYFHSPKILITSAGEDHEKVEGKNQRRWECTCGTKLGGVDLEKPRYKNLLMVSGPEGFINYFAGPKYWADGKERQGPVGGVIGELAKKYPNLASDWLVLKL